MYQQKFNSRLILAITFSYKKKKNNKKFCNGCVYVCWSVRLHPPVTCQSETVTDTSVTLCHQSRLKLSLATDTARAELDRSNFNQADFGLCQRCDRATKMLPCDWQIVYRPVLPFVLGFFPWVYFCVSACSLLTGSWHVSESPIFFESGVDWTLSSPPFHHWR